MVTTKALKKGGIYIITIPPKIYSSESVKIIKHIEKISKKICYVNLNKFLTSLIKDLEDSEIDTKKFFFVDAITKSTDPNMQDEENRKFVRSPSALTELSITIAEVLSSSKPEALFFDSISACLVYNPEMITVKFLHTLIGRIRAAKCTAVLTCLEQEKPRVIEDLGMFVDGTMNSKDFV
jgi:hypothetical protein